MTCEFIFEMYTSEVENEFDDGHRIQIVRVDESTFNRFQMSVLNALDDEKAKLMCYFAMGLSLKPAGYHFRDFFLIKEVR